MIRKYFFSSVVLGLASMAPAQYDFFVLHPFDSQGQGISGTMSVGFVYSLDFTTSYAALWSGGVYTDLHPSGYIQSSAEATDGTRQVGSGSFFDVDSNIVGHALKWTGTNVPVNLHNALGGAYFASQAWDVDGNFVVGTGSDNSYSPRAILWTSDTTYVDLSGGMESDAFAVKGGVQAGYVGLHAALWTGSAASMVDIHPSGFFASYALDTDGTQTVGGVNTLSGSQAALWNGTSFVLLHPAGYDRSVAYSVAGGKQVGSGTLAGQERALLWNGTNVPVDLHAFTPGYLWSRAKGIDAAGNIVGTGMDMFGVAHAVLWKPSNPYFGNFQNPVNDPASPESVFKRNATVNLRIKLFQSDGSNYANQAVQLEVEAIGTSTAPVNVDDLAQGYSTGNIFEYEAGTQTYRYLMSTKTLSAGVRYRITARMVSRPDIYHSVTIALR